MRAVCRVGFSQGMPSYPSAWCYLVGVPLGTIKKLVADRGFGFIAAEDGVEYFFHRSGLDRALNFESLQGGERVQFEIEQSQRGPRANHVRPA